MYALSIIHLLLLDRQKYLSTESLQAFSEKLRVKDPRSQRIVGLSPRGVRKVIREEYGMKWHQRLSPEFRLISKGLCDADKRISYEEYLKELAKIAKAQRKKGNPGGISVWRPANDSPEGHEEETKTKTSLHKRLFGRGDGEKRRRIRIKYDRNENEESKPWITLPPPPGRNS